VCGREIHSCWRGSYGVSDRGLAKICSRLNVPVPTVRTDITPREKELAEFEKRPQNLVSVNAPGTELHPLAAMARESLKRAKEDESGLLIGQEEWSRVLKVSKGHLERTLLVLDAVFRAFDIRGYKAVSHKEKKRLFVDIEGGEATFLVEELLDRKERELTKAQLQDKEKSPWLYRRPEHFYMPSGRLSLRLTSTSRGRTVWRDGKRQKVEECLNDFLAAIASDAARDLEAKRRRVREQWELKERERREIERKKRRAREKRKLWALLVESACWQRSQLIRGYAQAMKEACTRFSPAADEDESLKRWCEWALQQADAPDPLASGAFCTREERRPEPGYGQQPTVEVGSGKLAWERTLRRLPFGELGRDWWHRLWE
jgi:hypothetical protein